jgi:hypothetical protein
MQEQESKPVILVDSDQEDPPSDIRPVVVNQRSGGMYSSAPFSDGRIGAASTERSYQVPDHIRDQYNF